MPLVVADRPAVARLLLAARKDHMLAALVLLRPEHDLGEARFGGIAAGEASRQGGAGLPAEYRRGPTCGSEAGSSPAKAGAKWRRRGSKQIRLCGSKEATAGETSRRWGAECTRWGAEWNR